MTISRKWTEEEERRLLELKRQGKPVSAIAEELKRTQEAINTRLRVLNNRRPHD